MLLLDLLDFFGLVLRVIFYVCQSALELLLPPKVKSVDGLKIVITGAAKGIGFELARQFGELGALIVCWDIDEGACREAVQDLCGRGIQAAAVHVDVSNRRDVKRAAEKSRNLLNNSHVDVVINNAGILRGKRFLDLTEQDVASQCQVNFEAHVHTMQEFLPHMIKRSSGHFVAVSSIAGIQGTPYMSVYCATKFAVKGLMDALFLELRQDYPEANVKLTTAHPVTVDTGLAHAPVTRFPALLPILTPAQCANAIVQATLADQEEVFIPGRMWFISRISRLFPRKAQLATFDFVNYGIGVKED